jgi:hypothetical protein
MTTNEKYEKAIQQAKWLLSQGVKIEFIVDETTQGCIDEENSILYINPDDHPFITIRLIKQMEKIFMKNKVNKFYQKLEDEIKNW